MGSSHSGHVHMFQDLSNKTGFSIEQINKLHRRFLYLTHDEGTLRRKHLEDIKDLALNPIRRQIIAAFFDKRNMGQNEDGSLREIGFEEFLTILAFFSPPKAHSDEEEIQHIRRKKLNFLFNMHDNNHDGIITRADYRQVVEKLLSSYEALETEMVTTIVESAMKEEPGETYESITFQDFQQILKDIEIETTMNVHFINLDTITMPCGK